MYSYSYLIRKQVYCTFFKQFYLCKDHRWNTLLEKISHRKKYRCVVCHVSEHHFSYFKFPIKNAESKRQQTWLDACRITEDVIKSPRICEKHFLVSDFYFLEKDGNRRRLKKYAVPTQFFKENSCEDEKNTSKQPHSDNLQYDNDSNRKKICSIASSMSFSNTGRYHKCWIFG